MGAAVYLMKTALPGGRITTILCVIVGIVVFGFAAVIFKAVTKDDLSVIRRRKKAV